MGYHFSLTFSSAQQKLDEARELIRQTKKPYEPYVPDWDEWKPPEYVGFFKNRL